MRLEHLQDLCFKSFLKRFCVRSVSADKMLNRAKGPVWHRTQKEKGEVPKGLRGVDKEATWGYSRYDGWVYGHGVFCMVSHTTPFVGMFKWMGNSQDESKRLWWETGKLKGMVTKACMDAKADKTNLFYEMKRQHGIVLLTRRRKKKGKKESARRKEMYKEIYRKKNVAIYRRRATTVEPMQGVMKDIFDLDRCWMRGDAANRWLFAAMGVAAQMAQWKALAENQSTWSIKREVVGL